MWLLDTNVASELVKRLPDATVQTRFDATPKEERAISVVTLFELRFGAARAAYPSKLWSRIEDRILSRCAVLPMRDADALAAADLFSTIVSGGENITVQDILIGGTAWVARHTLVTRNTRHFQSIPGLKWENWFEPPSSPVAQA